MQSHPKEELWWTYIPQTSLPNRNMKQYKSDVLSVFRMSHLLAQALSLHIGDFLPAILHQHEVCVSSLVKIKPKYQNRMDVCL